MDIWMIWAEQDGFHWLVEAWDDDSTAGNNEGWKEAVSKAETAYPGSIRIVKSHIDFNAVVKAFKPVTVQAGPIRRVPDAPR